MKSKRLFFVMLSLTLVLGILCAGFIRPGFLLGAFQFRAPGIPKSATIVPENPEIRGNSRAFDITPVEGVRISAEEGAFDRDREFKMEKLSETEVESLQTDVGYDEGYIIGAWEMDAGLADDEYTPGSFKIEVDLKKLGIPEEYYDYIQLIRIDDAKNSYAYASALKGSVISCDSRQNSVLGAVVIPSVLIGGIAYFENKQYRDMNAIRGVKGEFVEEPPYNDGTSSNRKIFRLCLDPSEEKKALETEIHETLTKIWTSIDDREEKRDKKLKEKFNISDPNLASQEQRQIARIEAMTEAAKDNPDYKRLITALKDIEDNVLKEMGFIKETVECCQNAYKFMRDVAKTRLPKDVIDLHLPPTLKADGMTNTSFIGGKAFFSINFSALRKGERDQFQSTILHEFVHVVQREYTFGITGNKRFDEGSAVMVEMMAQPWFVENNMATSIPGTEIADRYEFYCIPLDESEIKGAALLSDKLYDRSKRENKYDEGDTGYPLAHFFKFLHKKRGGTIGVLFTAYYNAGVVSRKLTDILKMAYSLSSEDLTELYYQFVGQNRDKIADAIMDNCKFFLGSKNRAELKNRDYCVTVRMLRPITLQPERNYRTLVKIDSDFAEKLPDVRLEPCIDLDHEECLYGFYYKEKRPNYPAEYMLEIDGGIEQSTGFFSRTPKSGYTVYNVVQSPKIECEVSNNRLTFTLPEMSDAAKGGVVEGYRVTITCSDGKVTERIASLRRAGRKGRYRVSGLCNPGSLAEGAPDLTFSVTVCELTYDKDKEYLYGPESEGAELTQEMDELLEIMGAQSGKITVSLGWQTKDDLDLHVTTPDGSHIYYGNRSAGGGTLDVDMNVYEDECGPSAVENIFFPDPAPGVYKVSVVNYTDRTDGDTPFVVRVTVGETQKVFRLTIGSYSCNVTEFIYGDDGVEFEWLED